MLVEAAAGGVARSLIRGTFLRQAVAADTLPRYFAELRTSPSCVTKLTRGHEASVNGDLSPRAVGDKAGHPSAAAPGMRQRQRFVRKRCQLTFPIDHAP